jgi:hypothetical protein
MQANNNWLENSDSVIAVKLALDAFFSMSP